jgi:LmbE family N-acetylglucosaminyl deacetylase
VIVVSPHLDDAVLSCGQRLAQQPCSIVMTVFTADPPGRFETHPTPWDVACGLVGTNAVAHRRTEDRHALAALCAQPVWLDVLEEQYDGANDVSNLAERLGRALVSYRDSADVVVVPLGLWHREHVLVSDACLTVAAEFNDVDQWWLYADVPYATFEEGRLVDARLRDLRAEGWCLNPNPDEAIASPCGSPTSERKWRALSCYASQLRALGGPRIEVAASREHYWRLGRARA